MSQSITIDGTSIKSRGAANLRFDYSAYKRMAALKVLFYTRILKMGFNLWACDADTGWAAALQRALRAGRARARSR